MILNTPEIRSGNLETNYGRIFFLISFYRILSEEMTFEVKKNTVLFMEGKCYPHRVRDAVVW